MRPATSLASGLLAALVALLVGSAGFAQVRQPDGTQVPVGDSLSMYLRERMETIDVVRDAAVLPERFLPGCSIRFTVVVRDTSYQNSFGWYNVVSGRAPMASELYEFVSTTAPRGFTATLDLRSEARYRGGEIGFYLRTPPGHVYYSERAYQPDRESTGGFVHLLIYDSRVTPNAFYFGWEDLFGGGDNDFQDLLMIVDNLVCAGGGDACTTGERGVCAAGTRQCHNGALTCMRTTGPSPERCDGLDNDCNGMTDEGDGLCPAMQVCDRGTCVERCLSELGCRAGFACSPRGTCVEPACATVECPEGEVCVAGTCRAPCAGVTCPRGQVCRVDRCVDPCVGLTCDAEQVCVDGVCQTRCPCRRCPAGSTCYTDGRCRATDCATVTCTGGQYCQGGRCLDPCAGAVCPPGQECSLGACRDAPRDAGVLDSGAPDATTMTDVPSTDIARVDTGVRRDVSVRPGSDSGDAEDEAPSGCACRVPGAPVGRGEGTWGALALAAAVGLFRALRRGAFQRARRSGRSTEG